MSKQLEALISRAKHIVENGGLLARDTSLALISALEQAQQYAKQRDTENQDLMLTIGRLRVEREQLEGSPLAVKLPERFYPDGDIEVPEVMNADEVIEAIRAAGGKVEGE
ncbi:hypothetical protein [Cedecea neteri]|uniref:hypothetical protein n=1 Tax=Cedecea neteri TaxID=158822 RepID=UPI002897AFEA|nr:hypothetical protein [Cedecea neteri]